MLKTQHTQKKYPIVYYQVYSESVVIMHTQKGENNQRKIWILIPKMCQDELTLSNFPVCSNTISYTIQDVLELVLTKIDIGVVN